jgi:hypothetical protein
VNLNSDIWRYLTTQTGAAAPLFVVLIIAGAGVFYGVKAARFLVPLARKIQHGIDDLFGEEERPGVPARPGVVAQVAGLKETVQTILAEVQPNHGGSIKDKTDKNSRDIEHLTRKVDGVVSDISDIREALGIRRAATEEGTK